jgi:hypothetical protein
MYPPADSALDQIENLKKKNALLCLDKLDNKGKPLDDLNVYGVFGNSRSIEITVMPCNPKELTEENKHLEKTECLVKMDGTKSENEAALAKKFQESKKYLGRPAINIVGNNQRLDLEKFVADGVD